MEEKMGAVIGGKKLNRLGSKPGRFKRMVARHLGKKAAEKIQSSDGARLVAKGKKTGNKQLVKTGGFIRNMFDDVNIEEEVGFPDDGWGTTKSKRKLKKVTPGEKDMKESNNPNKMAKLRQLSKAGLVSKKDMSKFDTLMRKVERAGGDMSRLTNQERSFLAGMYDDLISTIINDPAIFTRMRRKGTQKESVQEASNNPQRDHKAAENNERAQLPGAKTQMQKKRILDRIEYHKKMQVRKEDSHADGSYSKKKLKMAAEAATELDSMLGDRDDLPEWVQGKITKAADYLDSARDYMKNQGDDGKAPVGEETEIGGKTFDDLELCPRAVKAFKKDLANAKDKQAVLDAAQAVDNYLAIERKGLDGKVTEQDLDKMKELVTVAKKKIADAGLRSSDHNYHQGHIDTTAKLVKKSMNEGMYKSPAHARLQKHMNRIRQTSAYKNKVRQLGGTPLKPGEQNPMKRTTEKVDMKEADMGDVIRDFEKSDAPQFKGKSKSKRREMAIAAKLASEEACCDDCKYDHTIEEAVHNGKKVNLNDPIRTNEVPSKKFKVYVKDGDKIKVVRFGDPNLSIKRDDPARRKSFRARHNCDNPGPKTKARYWSCYQWRASQKVDN